MFSQTVHIKPAGGRFTSGQTVLHSSIVCWHLQWHFVLYFAMYWRKLRSGAAASAATVGMLRGFLAIFSKLAK